MMGRVKDLVMRENETSIMDCCPECEGDGHVFYEVARPQSFTRDVGYLEEVQEVCSYCCGDGEVERLCDSCLRNVVTLGMGHDAHVCEECSYDGGSND